MLTWSQQSIRDSTAPLRICLDLYAYVIYRSVMKQKLKGFWREQTKHQRKRNQSTKWYLWKWTGRITWYRRFSSKVGFLRRKVENSSTWISWMVSKASKSPFWRKRNTVSARQLYCGRSVLSKWHKISACCSEMYKRVQEERCCGCDKESAAAK